MSDMKIRIAESGSIFKSICRWGIGALLGAVTLMNSEAVFPPHPSYSTNVAITGQILSGDGGGVVGVQGRVDYFTTTNKFFLWNTTNLWTVLNDSTNSIYFDLNSYAYRLTNDWADTDPAEMSAAYNFNTLYTFFRTIYSRDSFDGHGAMSKIHVHAVTGDNVPSFSGPQGGFYVADGTAGIDGPSGVLDLCGWSYADAIIKSDLGYSGIGGTDGASLQISFCNIFAFLAEYYNQPNNLASYPATTPGQSDWLIGEDMKLDYPAIYDIRNPANPLVEVPRAAMITAVITNDVDSRKFYSGVQDQFFYYLSIGGPLMIGTNVINVQGIGIEAAGQIAFRAVTKYFGQSMSFLDSRRAWLHAADDSDFAGLTTNAVRTAILAWNAVGITDDSLTVYPGNGFSAGGEYPLGPLVPNQKVYYVFNPTKTNHDWAVTSSVPWIAVSTESMTVPKGTFTNVNVSFSSSDILAMGEGYHTSSIVFTNITISNAYYRNVTVASVRNYQAVPTVYSWRTPAVAPTYLPMSDDQVAGPLTVPFANGWRFFAERKNQFYVGANGLMGVDPTAMDTKVNSFFPQNDSPNGIVAPLWDDWVPGSSSTSIYYFIRGSAPNREWVVTWNDMHHITNIDTKASFQVVIKEGPTNRNNDIIFQYQTVTDNGVVGAGRSATIGVEDRLGYVGNMYSSNGSRWVTSQRAILYSTNPPIDSIAPTGEIVLESVSLASSSAVYVVRFSESVTGLTLSDFNVSGTAGGAAVALEGAGMVYRVTVAGFAHYGTLNVGLPSGTVFDEAGNPNIDAIGPYQYSIPVQSMNPAEDFEGVLEFWDKPVTNYANAWRDVWRQGIVPADVPPGFAYQGTHAWMAVVTNAEFFPVPLDAWFESPEFQVGDFPVIQFAVWYDTQARLTVEAYDGTTWRNVTPADMWNGAINEDLGDALTGSSYYWFPMQVALDSTLFGNRKIRVRFRLVGFDLPGVRAAIDSFQVVDALNPGVYIVNYSPTNIAPSTVSTINYTVYNSYTTTVLGAVGLRSISDPGVTLASPMSSLYGDLPAGATQGASVALDVGTLAQLQGNHVQVLHTVTNGSGRVGANVLDFTVLGATNQLGINRLTALGGVVTNWVGQPLYGNGLLYSCIYQILDAGPDGVISPPTTNGTPTGDDHLLYSVTPIGISSFGRFGDNSVPADAGYFKAYVALFDPIPRFRSVYARAWDSDNFGTAIAYGDSPLVELATNGSQTVDFGDWVVGTAIKPGQDTDGDSILDGYSVAHGLEARKPVEPLALGMDFEQTIGSGGTGRDQFQSPVRVVTTERFMFVLDNVGNSLQVWDVTTHTNIYNYTNGFRQPFGLALDPRPGTNRVAIADTGNDRIRVMEFDPLTGTNWTWLFDIGSRGSADGQLYKPNGVAIGPDGSFYVADTRPDWDVANSRTSVFDQSGNFTASYPVFSTENRPYDTAVTPGGDLYIVGGDGVSIASDLNSPRGIQNGVADRIYIADSGNHRIKVYTAHFSQLLLVAGQPGAAPGQLNMPWDVWPSMNDNRIYVADTGNNRIQIFKTRIDLDMDGMDDVWEDAVGLDSSVNDALDPWGVDNLTNIGAYRLGLLPGQGLEQSLSVMSVFAAPLEGGVVFGGGSYEAGTLQSISATPTLFWRFTQWADGDSNNPRTVLVPATGTNYVAKFEKDLAPITLNRFLYVGQNLAWNATNQGVYSLEYSTNLAVISTSMWMTVPGPAITSIVNGFMVWTNTLPITNNPVFYRVKWINAP